MTANNITSLTNPRIKSVVRLRNRRQRDQDGLTIVEGLREVQCALAAGVLLQECFVVQEEITSPRAQNLKDLILKEISKLKIPIVTTPPAVFQKISYGDRHEGVLAVCKVPVDSFEQFKGELKSLFVVVEHVEKPGNLGAILRTCDAAGVGGVIVCDPKTDLYNPNVIRASLGTVFTNKVVVASNEEVLAFLKKKKVKICAALPQGNAVYTESPLTGPLAIVVGSEESGLSDFWPQYADWQVRIPMHGEADSLNVSTSTAILLYEALRQRKF